MPTRHVTAALALALCAASAAGCRHPAPLFSESNARAHVNQLAGAIGSRPAGTDANRRAREYISEQLRFFGFSVRIQEADGSWPAAGVTAHVANVIGILPGERPEAIGLVAHYDSQPETPGAGDDGSGVAVVLEAARQLAAAAPRRYTVLALVTDAEEDGLLGARALVTDPEVRSRLRAFVNVDAAGSDAPAVLFQTGPGNGWLVRAWARAAPAPRGTAWFTDIYRRLPNGTDFTPLAAAGIPGLNIAAVGDGYAYHAPGDVPERVTRDLLLHMGQTVLATMQALDRTDITERTSEEPVFFDLAGRRAIVLSRLSSRALSLIAIVLGVLAIVRAARVVTAIETRAAAWRAVGWGVATTAAIAAALAGTCALLRAVREVYHPWYAHPTRLWVCLGLVVVLVTTVLARAARHAPSWLRVPAHPAAVWMGILPIWLTGVIATEAVVPAAAYLWSLPLLAAALPLLIAPSRRGVIGALASVAVLVVAASAWLPDAATLLQFAVPTFGRLPVVTPIGFYALGSLAIALVVVPPVVALLAAVTRPVPLARSRLGRALDALIVSGLAAGVAVSFASAYTAPAYTTERPLRRTARYVADHAAGTAAWEIGSNEPGFDLHGGPAAAWRSDKGFAPVLPGLPIGPLPHPFRFRAPAPLAPAPMQADGRWAPRDGEIDVEVTIRPGREGLVAAVLLPPGVVPLRSTQPGAIRDGWWTAAAAGAGPDAVVITLTLPAAAARALGAVRAAVSSSGGVPLASGALGPPPAGSREAWRTRATHVAPLAWTPPLR